MSSAVTPFKVFLALCRRKELSSDREASLVSIVAKAKAAWDDLDEKQKESYARKAQRVNDKRSSRINNDGCGSDRLHGTDRDPSLEGVAIPEERPESPSGSNDDLQLQNVGDEILCRGNGVKFRLTDSSFIVSSGKVGKTIAFLPTQCAITNESKETERNDSACVRSTSVEINSEAKEAASDAADVLMESPGASNALDSLDADSGLEVFFSDAFPVMLLADPKRTFRDIFITLECQWKDLCSAAKLVYTARHVLRTLSLSSPPKPDSSTEQRCRRMVRVLRAKMDECNVGKNSVDEQEESEDEREQDVTDPNSDALCEVIWPEPRSCPAPTCDFHFASLSVLSAHLEGVAPAHARGGACPLCPAHLTSALDLRTHVLLHRGLKHACATCHAMLASHEDLRRHRRREHVVRCTFKQCGEWFSLSSALHRHLLGAHLLPASWRSCEFCGSPSVSADANHEHVVRAHHREVGLSAKDPYVSNRAAKGRRPGAAVTKKLAPPSKKGMLKTLTCVDCATTFSTLAKLKYHRLKNHGGWRGKIRCPKCPKQYGSRSNLSRHLRDAHDCGPLVTTDASGRAVRKANTLTCPHCVAFVTHDAAALRLHVSRRHKSSLRHSCPRCSTSFSTRLALTAHVGRCGAFACSVCKLAFRSQKRMRRHICDGGENDEDQD